MFSIESGENHKDTVTETETETETRGTVSIADDKR